MKSLFETVDVEISKFLLDFSPFHRYNILLWIRLNTCCGICSAVADFGRVRALCLNKYIKRVAIPPSKYASVAHSVEQLIRNEQVIGSNPIRSSKKYK